MKSEVKVKDMSLSSSSSLSPTMDLVESEVSSVDVKDGHAKSSSKSTASVWPPDCEVGGSGFRPLPPTQQRLNEREHASVFKITYFPPKAHRPKMRTKEWHANLGLGL
jgi:hypothetical protein